jgi:hypothetical protein
MRAFILIAAILSLPVFGKAFGWYLFAYECDPEALTFTLRLALPFVEALLGYLIFMLEGAQSSVILANKLSPQTLVQTLGTIDATDKQRGRAQKLLASSLHHNPIDNFIVGRQILIIVLAFLFKLAYDAASLQPAEILALQNAGDVCPATTKLTLGAYLVLDHWLFATLVSSLLIAVVFQVLAKLMAQSHPMRFLTGTWLALYCVPVCQWVGRISFLAVPLRSARRGGERIREKGGFSFFASREFAPVDENQSYNALVSQVGESVIDLSIELSRTTRDNEPVFLVRVLAMYEVITPNKVFGHVIFPVDINDAEVSAVALMGASTVNLRPMQTVSYRTRKIRERPGRNEVQGYFRARFDRIIPAGSRIAWTAQYFMPIHTETDPDTAVEQVVFDVPIVKPVRAVTFYVEEEESSDPEVRLVPTYGIETPRCGTVVPEREHGRRMLRVNYPSIGSRLHFRF